MTRADVQKWMELTFKECQRLRDAGQKEYARAEDNAFANFERVAAYLNISREKALLVYALKHFDGITSYVDGHKSQREDVRGRINDAITYLVLLRAMIEQREAFVSDFMGEYNLQSEASAAKARCADCPNCTCGAFL